MLLPRESPLGRPTWYTRASLRPSGWLGGQSAGPCLQANVKRCHGWVGVYNARICARTSSPCSPSHSWTAGSPRASGVVVHRTHTARRDVVSPSSHSGLKPKMWRLVAGLFAPKHMADEAEAGSGGGGGRQKRGEFLDGVLSLEDTAAAATEAAAAKTGRGAVGRGESLRAASEGASPTGRAAAAVGVAAGAELTAKPLGFYFTQQAAAGSKHRAHWEAVARIRGALLGEDKGNGTHPLGFYFGLGLKSRMQLGAQGAASQADTNSVAAAAAAATPAQRGQQRRQRWLRLRHVL